MNRSSSFVKVYAVAQGVTGLVLLFVPESLADMSQPGSSLNPVLVQLLGAAFLGMAAGNWTAKESILGGIYGRAVVAGSQTFTFIGTLVLIGSFPENPTYVFLWVFLILCAGMVLFSVLQFRPSWLDKNM